MPICFTLAVHLSGTNGHAEAVLKRRQGADPTVIVGARWIVGVIEVERDAMPATATVSDFIRNYSYFARCPCEGLQTALHTTSDQSSSKYIQIFSKKSHELISQVIDAGKVADAQPFVLQDAKPLLHLVFMHEQYTGVKWHTKRG